VAGVVGSRRAAGAGLDQHLEPAHPARKPDRTGAARARDVGAASEPARTGAHRNRADAEHRAGAAAAAGIETPGRLDLDRRFWHRLFVAFVPEAVADRYVEDRPLLRARARIER